MNRTFQGALLTLALFASLSWSGTAHAQTFTNSSLIDILDDTTIAGDGIVRKASLYPSPIVVSGIVNPINKVTVTLHNFWHGWVRDVDIILIGPNHQSPSALREWTTIMSDVGGQTPGIPSTSPITLTFDDAAPNSLLFDVIPSSGVYKPSNTFGGETPDPFPDIPDAPAVPASRPTTLSVFNGHQANGTWRLYVVDDGNTLPGNPVPSIGQIMGGWSLTINANVPEPGTFPLLFCGALVSGRLLARRRRG